MTMMIKETRKQNSFVVATRVELGLVREGSNQGQGNPLGGLPSLARHLSLSDLDATSSRPERAYDGAAQAAIRAGRSGCSAGVLHRVGSARFAERTTLCGWFTTGRHCCATSWSGSRMPAPYQLPRQQRLSGRPTATLAAPFTATSLGSWLQEMGARKREIVPALNTMGG